jgi:hypothetical protein
MSRGAALRVDLTSVAADEPTLSARRAARRAQQRLKLCKYELHRWNIAQHSGQFRQNC